MYLLGNKNDFISSFQTFNGSIERQTGNKVKIIRSDNDREYVNETKWESRTRQSDHCGKCYCNPTCQTHFGAEAADTAVCALNPRPSKPNDKIPYEKWFNKAYEDI